MPFPPSGQTATLATYRTELRRLLHDATGKFWSDTELNDYINAGRFRVAADAGCIRSLVTSYLSTGLEQYPIGGVTGGLVTNTGVGYTNISVTVTGDGSGATATATLLPATTAVAGGAISAIMGSGGFGWSGAIPALAIVGDGTGATAIAYYGLGFFATLGVGGTGYKVGDLVSPLAGTATQPGFMIVTAIGALGVVTSLQIARPGLYTSINNPGGPPVATFSTGSGTGCTITTDFTLIPFVVNAGKGYTTCDVTVTPNTGAADLAGVSAPLVAAQGGLAQIVVSNPGTGYTSAQFLLSGDGAGAAATASVIPYNTLDIMNVSPIWGNTRPPCNYQPWTEFNARTRLFLSRPGTPSVWSRYGTSGGSAFLGAIPDQPYKCEFDTAILPATLTSDSQADQLQFPYTSPVCYYAAWKAKLKQQALSEAESFLGDYKREVMFAQAAVMMRRVPNPYSGYTGG